MKHLAGARRQDTQDAELSAYPSARHFPDHPRRSRKWCGRGHPSPAVWLVRRPEASTRTPRRSMLRAGTGVCSPPGVGLHRRCVDPGSVPAPGDSGGRNGHAHISPAGGDGGTTGVPDASNWVWIPRTVQCGRPPATTRTTRMSSSGGIGSGGSSRCSASEGGVGTRVTRRPGIDAPASAPQRLSASARCASQRTERRSRVSVSGCTCSRSSMWSRAVCRSRYARRRRSS